MRCVIALLAVASLVSVVTAEPEPLWDRVRNAARNVWEFPGEVRRGTGAMIKAYKDMREANYIGADKYFHSRGNYDAAKHGAGGRFAATVISNARELTDTLRGKGGSDSARDQEANRWGRNGGDPNRYRPRGLPEKY
ncbi:serum amyloid A protein [Cherax quadricarinatus]|nr:serum amyloid A protein-like [Cherax quadricarinatus]